MQNDAIWQAFAETGDPVCYLLYKATRKPKEPKNTKDRPGNEPRTEG